MPPSANCWAHSSPDEWTDSRQLADDASAALKRLLKAGLVLGAGKRHAALRERDETLRGVYWHPLAATLHAFTRWHDADAVQAMQDTGTETAGELREVLGAPPVEAMDRGDPPAIASPCRAPPATTSTSCSRVAPPAATSTPKSRCLTPCSRS